MHILVTRPLADALPLKAALEAAGHRVSLAPMMDIVLHALPFSLAGMQALLFTSANGVRAFAAASLERHMPAWTVGPATAATARAAGFQDVHVAGGDAVALAADVIAALQPEAGGLFHAAGERLAKELGPALQAAGFSYRKAVLYEARAIGNLPRALLQDLPAGRLDAVLLFSPRTARLFLQCIEDAGLAAALGRLDAYCLSPAVAQAARAARWRRIVTAPQPDGASLLDLIGRI